MERRDLIETGMTHWRVVLTFLLILVAYGLISFFTMPRQEFPDFTIRQGLVVGVMPGATSEEVEERLAKPVEEYLFSFKEVRKAKTYSVSQEGQMVVYVELNDDVSGTETPAFWTKLRHGLSELRQQKLPSQVLALIGNNDFGDTSALLLTVAAPGRSPRDLEEYAEVLQRHLRALPATSKLRLLGDQPEEIQVTLARDRLVRHAVRPLTVLAALQGMGGAPAEARLDLPELELPVHVDPILNSEAQLASLPILGQPGGAQVRLGDVAEIHRVVPDDRTRVRYNGGTALVLSVEMQSGHDITAFGREVDLAIDQASRELPTDVRIARVVDQPQVVRTTVGHFLRDFGLAIASVILVTMLLLPLRVAAVAAISIPVCIAITLGVLNALGVQLQTVSLAGLVIVLGMVVDNAIVIIDDHVERLDQGLDSWSAAVRSGRELAVPVLSATLAIILSFAPLGMFLTGQSADFLKSLPVTIAAALLSSFVVALTLVPVMNSRFIRHGLHRDQGKPSLLDRLQAGYDRLLEATFRHPRWTLAGAGLSVVLALVLMTQVPQQPFPKVERNQFAVEVNLPSGRSLAATDSLVRRVERELMGDKRVMNVTSFVGQGSPRFHTLYAPHVPSRNYGQLIVNTVSNEATEELLAEFSRRWNDKTPEGWVRWKQLVMQFGSPVEIRLRGEDPEVLHRAANQAKAFARTLPGVTWARDDWEEGRASLDFQADPEAGASLGVPPSLLQAAFALGSQGVVAATVWEGDYPVSVRLQDESRVRHSMEGFRQQTVSSLYGGMGVPLAQLGGLRPAWHDGARVRRNGQRTITVSLDMAPNALAAPVQAAMEQWADRLHEPGVQVAWGGERELAEEVFVPMGISLGVSLLLIFLVLLLQFGRFRQVGAVMSAMPLSLLGAVGGLAMSGYPFGVTAFLGLIGLMGIVVRNGLILVTYAEELRRDGMDIRSAALAAGKRRMRPIYLTAMAAAIGVVPMIISKSALWGPLGTVTCFGLLGGMILTLLALPVIYVAIVETRHSRGRPQTIAGGATVLGLLALLAWSAPAAGAEGGLSLSECLARTKERHFDVQVARLETQAAQHVQAGARSRFLPDVSGVGGGFQARDALVAFPAMGLSLAGDGTVAGLTATQTLFAGGRVLAGSRLADVGVAVARQREAMALRDALAATEEKYWRLVTLDSKARTLRAYLDLLAALERQAAEARKAGLATETEVLKVQVAQAKAAVDVRRLDDGRLLAARDLARQVGLPDDPPPMASDSLGLPAELDLEPGTQVRPELLMSEQAVEAEHWKKVLERGEGLPALALGGVWYRMDVDGMHAETNSIAVAMVTVPMTGIWLGQQAGLAGAVRQEAAELKLAETRRLLALDLERCTRAYAVSRDAVAAAELSCRQAELELRDETMRHDQGLGDTDDLLEAQLRWKQACDERLDALQACRLALVALHTARGSGGVAGE